MLFLTSYLLFLSAPLIECYWRCECCGCVWVYLAIVYTRRDLCFVNAISSYINPRQWS